MMLRWFGFSLLIFILIVGLLWIGAASKSDARQQASQNLIVKAKEEKQIKTREQEQREYVLEVIGLGVTVDKYRQGKLWEVLQKSSPYTHVVIHKC